MYTYEQIRDMIYSYHWRKNILIDEGYIQDSNGIAQYGIDATMPKPQGKTTDKVQAIATRNYVLSRVHDEHIEVVSFIDKYEQRYELEYSLSI